MPRELRKRGKKHKKSQHQVHPENHERSRDDHHPKNSSEPSWIVPARRAGDACSEEPFGCVDPDIKAYFRSVDEQMQSWQEAETQPEDEDDSFNPNEARSVFFVAALGEISGREKQLATDPECSVVLERMAHSMDDFVLRVLLDRLSGSFELLFSHRFASHVCQTLISVAAGGISREVNGIFPDAPISEENGELRTLTQLMLDICEEISPSFNSLVMDQFASHVLRSLLLLLCPNICPEGAARKSVRSKKSMSWKAKQGHMKSFFSSEKEKETNASSALVPASFHDTASRFLQILRDGLSANEVRALAPHKVAGPILQLLLEVEADHNCAASPNSLMDRVLAGMIKSYFEDSTASIQPSDYFVALLRDPTSSRLLETLVSRCPEQIFNLVWSTYFEGKLERLALHPVANYVLAKAIERHDCKQLGNTLEELKSSWIKLITSSRTGVLRASIDRAGYLRTHQEGVCEAALAAVGLRSPDDKIHLVPCMLLLKSLKEIQALPSPGPLLPEAHSKRRGDNGEADDQRSLGIQGALVLQSLLKLDEPQCSIVADSISSLSAEDVIQIAHNATSSRVLDALLESPTVPFKAKRRFVISLLGHYRLLADDRIGSRVADRCWAFADPYLREKIARSLIPFEQFLTASFYGRFFVRKLELYLLQRRPDEWRTLQSNSKTSPTRFDQQNLVQTTSGSTGPPHPSKKLGASEDEIDAVFQAALGNKTKKAAVGRGSMREGQPQPTDRQMSEVLGAIREAPSGERPGRTKRRKAG